MLISMVYLTFFYKIDQAISGIDHLKYLKEYAADMLWKCVYYTAIKIIIIIESVKGSNRIVSALQLIDKNCKLFAC